MTFTALTILASCIVSPPSIIERPAKVALGSIAVARDTVPRAARPLLSRRQALIGAAAVGASLAMRPLDQRVNSALQHPELQTEHGLHGAAKSLAFLGGQGPFVFGATFVSLGALSGNRGMLGVGARVTESVTLAAAVNALAKGIAGRALPGVQTKHEFSFGRGFHDNNGPFVAFPSGHTAAAFALATSLSVDAARSSPVLGRVVAPVAFVAATGVGVARLYQHVHWLSDLPLAAAIGIWSARTVEARTKKPDSAERRRNVIDGVGIAPTRGGVAISWSSLRAAR